MSLIVLEDGHLNFGSQEVFKAINLNISQGERIGLIGPNGSGKTTLLRVLSGEQNLDGGQVRLSKGCRIGYLPQDVLDLAGDTILDSVLETVPGRGDIENRLLETEAELGETSDPDEQMALATALSDLHEQLDHFQTYFSEHRATTILAGLGFTTSDLARPTAELSGGWKMRAALAGLLFQNPDVLFLDEPTNHLDVLSVRWLDQFLEGYPAATILICHDRDFLNRHVERVLSFEPEGLRIYKGTYDLYLEQRAVEEEVLEAKARNQAKELKDMERFVERFRAKATKARQAQSRAKQIKRLEASIDKPIQRRRKLKFSFPPTARSGRDVILIEGISKRFGELELYNKVTKAVHSGDRVNIIGINGAGKTTLLKMIAGELAPDDGTIKFGANVDVGYYAQHHTELLNPRNTVLEEVWQMKLDASESTVRGICGAFLFSGDDVDKVVGVLSGGERARVLLARLLVKPGNLLLMDEPTNHLDIASAEALANALDSYDGTVVFVSHNSSFVNHLATKVWDISKGEIIEHPGNLREYLEHLEVVEAERNAPPPPKETQRTSPKQTKKKQQSKAPSKQGKNKKTAQQQDTKQASDEPNRSSRKDEKERKRQEAQRRNELNRRTKSIRQEIKKIESRIADLEAEQSDLEPQMADPEFYKDQTRFREALNRFNNNREKLTEIYARWEYQQTELENAEKEFKDEKSV
jgi:ATP-binding cassette, subfamily F, member 3